MFDGATFLDYSENFLRITYSCIAITGELEACALVSQNLMEPLEVTVATKLEVTNWASVIAKLSPFSENVSNWLNKCVTYNSRGLSVRCGEYSNFSIFTDTCNLLRILVNVDGSAWGIMNFPRFFLSDLNS
jgi:hypothetical protein